MTGSVPQYAINPEVIRLLEQLCTEGYAGRVAMTNRYPSGVAGALTGCFSMELPGFCKESLFLTADESSGDIHAFGRYAHEACWKPGEAQVIDIVAIALRKEHTYRHAGYTRPSEFLNLFEKYEQVVSSEKQAQVLAADLPAGAAGAGKPRL